MGGGLQKKSLRSGPEGPLRHVGFLKDPFALGPRGSKFWPAMASYGLRWPVCSRADAPTGSRLKLTRGSRIKLVGSTRLKDQPGSMPLWFVCVGYQIGMSKRIGIGYHIDISKELALDIIGISKRICRTMLKLRRQMVY